MHVVEAFIRVSIMMKLFSSVRVRPRLPQSLLYFGQLKGEKRGEDLRITTDAPAAADRWMDGWTKPTNFRSCRYSYE